MRFKRTARRWFARGESRRREAGFTLAEALAALMFLALVIPVAVEGLRVANLAGQVAERKAVAARLADRLLNEMVVTRQWQQASSSGSVQEGAQQYRWEFRSQMWNESALKLLTLRVVYQAQGQERDVEMSTIVDTTR